MQEINKAFKLFDEGEYKQAEKIYLACLNGLTDEQPNLYKVALNGLGYVTSHQGQYEKARQYFKEVLDISLNQEDKKEEAMALHQLGMVERMAGEFNDSLYYFNEEEKIWKHYFPEFYLGFSANSYEKGYIAIKQGQYDEARAFFRDSLAFAESANSSVAEGCAYRGMGELEMAKLNFDKAKIHFQQATAAFNEAGDSIAIKEIQGFLFQCQQLHSTNKGAIENGNKENQKR